MELSSLHPDYFNPDISVFEELGLKENEEYLIIRFVSWAANHDFGKQGLNFEQKRRLVDSLKQKHKIFISSEGYLPDDLEPYRLRIHPSRIHDVIAFAKLYLGEGATMASESAMLGTPAIYVNPISAGTLEAQEKYGLLYCFRSFEGVMEKTQELLSIYNLKKDIKVKRDKMLAEKISMTDYLVSFIDNYFKINCR
jgi:hypothetical protein